MKLWFLSCLIMASVFGNAQKKWVVAKDGTGNYTTVQAAFNAIRNNNEKKVIIFVKRGIYQEKLTLQKGKNNVHLVGEDKFNTILTYNDHTGKISPSGDTINTRTSASFFMYADDFTAENITFENPAGFTAGQAVAVQADGDKATFINCRFVGNQDVLFTNNSNSRQYFKSCYIEGTTDFIFGSSTAWFQQCHIHSKKNSHITAAATPKEKAYGYVFNDCILTADSSLRNVSLGRPWQPFASVVYMHTYIGPHIIAAGWANWNKTENYKTTRYAEYHNYGPGAATHSRVTWSRQLTDAEADTITIQKVLAGWDPEKK
jgi:pectinesterase